MWHGLMARPPEKRALPSGPDAPDLPPLNESGRHIDPPPRQWTIAFNNSHTI
jgi:hypothetical protein